MQSELAITRLSKCSICFPPAAAKMLALSSATEFSLLFFTCILPVDLILEYRGFGSVEPALTSREMQYG